MKTEFGQAAKSLLTGDGSSSKQVAEQAARACDRLAKHLARLLGDTGVQLLLKRSIVLATQQFPWLAATPTAESASSALRDAMEQQDPDSITDAFVAVLSAFVGLLERLIGAGLVERLLEEVWPAVFTHGAKDTQ